MRQVLGNEAAALSLEEKYQVLTAYMNGGGVQGLLEDDKVELDPEEQKLVEDEFGKIYTTDPKLREVLGSDPSALSIKEKY